jgi:hypothetical protein
MADADWVKYKAIRGKPLPESARLIGADYRLKQTLKKDFYAAVGIYVRADAPEDGTARTPPPVLLKIYHTDRLFLLPLGGVLGRFLCRREVGFLERLGDVEGIPHFLELHGESGFVREYVPGCNLREFTRDRRVDDAFFPALRATLDAVHSRGISHNDLSKPENILVTTDGRPVLIDFQIATRVRADASPFRRAASRRFVRYMQGVDRYHLAKLHSRRRPEDFTDSERQQAQRKGLVLIMHGWVRRPYRAVRHFVLRHFLTAPTTHRA